MKRLALVFSLCAAVPAMAQLSDLIVERVGTTQTTTDSQTLAISGTVQAKIRNVGGGIASGSIRILAFEDRNGNGRFDSGTDASFGSVTAAISLSVGAQAEYGVPVSGTVLFRGNRIFVHADADNLISEANEANNLWDSGQNSQHIPAAGVFNPVVKWHKTSFSVLPLFDQVVVTPSVIDLDGDRIPDVVFSALQPNTVIGGGSAPGVLRAISGADGRELWTVQASQYRVEAIAQPVVGDIDGDGKPEIVCVHFDHTLIAFEHDGSFKWKGTKWLPARGYGGNFNWGGASLADLDGNGIPEIVFGGMAFSNNGALLWQGQGYSGDNDIGPLSAVSDINLDGKPEVVAGNTVYRPDGTILWLAPIPDGFPGVGNFDEDLFAEVVVVSGGSVYLLDHDGQIKWGPVGIPGGGLGGAPTIGDFDGDGKPEIGVAGARAYVVLETDGTVKWQAPTRDDSSNMTGSSLFDFEGDGTAEVVYADEEWLRIYRGSDGAELYKLAKSSGTSYEYPVIVDVDGDGRAEIVAVANSYYFQGSGVLVIGDASNNWVSTRRIWNQHTYHITNVNDDGTIPRYEQPNWLLPGLNNFRLNTFPEPQRARSAPDFVPSFIRSDASTFPSSVRLTARIGNGGSAQPPLPFINLLVNGDAEGQPGGDGTALIRPIPGWQTNGNITATLYSTGQGFPVVSDPGPQNRGQNFFSGGPSNEYSSAFQDIVAPTGKSLGGASFGLSAWLGGYATQNDRAIVTATFRGPAGNDLGSVSIGPVTNVERGNGTSFLFRETTGIIPAGTTNVRVQMECIRSEGSFNDGYLDNVAFAVRFPDSPSALPPTVSFYRGDPATGGTLIGTTQTSKALAPGEFEDVSITWNNPPAGSHPIVAVADPGNLIAEGDETNNKAGANIVLGVQAAPLVDSLIARFKNQSADVAWARVTNAVSYNVYRRGQTGGAQRIRSGVTGASITDTGLTNGQTYFYTVRWVNAQGAESGDGTEASATPTPTGSTGNTPPTILSYPVTRGTVGQPYSYALRAADPDPGEALTYSLTSPPPGMTISPAGLIQWTPAIANAGYSRISVRVQDGTGRFATQSYQLFIDFVVTNNPPTITSTAITRATSGQLYAYTAVGRDPDTGDLLIYSLDTAPAGMSINPATGLIQWTPLSQQVGNHTVTARVRDLGGLSATQTFVLAVQRGNTAPRITSAPVTTLQLSFPPVGASFADTTPWTLIFNPLGSYDGPNWVRESGGTVAQQTNNPDVTMLVSDFGFTNARLEGTLRTDSTDDDYIGFAFGLQDDRHYYRFDWAEASINAERKGMALCVVDLPTPIEANDLACPSPDSRARTLFVNSIPWQRQTEYRYTLTHYLGQIQITVKQGNQLIESFAVADSTFTGGKFAFYDLSQPIAYFSVTPPVYLQGAYQYQVQATDAENDALTYSLVSAPAGMTIHPTTGLIQWNASIGDIGGKPVTVRVQDTGGLFASQTFAVQVPPPNRVPVITSTPTTLASAGQLYQAPVVASDPDPGDVLTYSLQAGPDGMTINPVTGLLQWTPTAAQDGKTFDVRVVVTDSGGLNPTQMFKVTVGQLQPPVISSSPVTSAVVNTSYAYQVTASDPQGLPLAYSLTAAPSGMTINVVNGLVQWMPVAGQVGAQNVTVKAQDTAGMFAVQSFAIQVSLTGPPSSLPKVTLSVPVNGVTLAQDVTMIGTVADDDLRLWRVEYRPAGEVQWRTLTSGTAPVNNGSLGLFPATLLANDIYRLRLYAEDTGGAVTTPEIEITVNTQQLKLGDFTMTFEDMRIPGLGLPVGIQRTYDTKQPQDGGFGPNWALSFTGLYLRRDVNYNVFVTLPSGRRVKFNYTPQSIGLGVFNTGFTGENGVYDTLENTDCPQVFGAPPTPLCNGFQLWQPENWILKTKEGFTYHITSGGGVRRMEDRNGNWMEITADGITASNGQNIPFTRDGQGRITEIREPSPSPGVLRYHYDAAGRLAQFVNAAGAVTRYFYENAAFPNYLTKIEDPLGRPALRNVFDESGRLIAQCDANGNPATLVGCARFNPDAGARTQTIYNSRGFRTDLILDARGNILNERRNTDATSYLETVRTYDANDNLLTEKDPDGNTKTFTYDSRGNKLTSVDPGGRTTTYTYNSCDKVATETDPASNVTSYAYDTACNLTSVTDPLGGVTAYTYNANGKRTSMTDAGGSTWQWTYDAYGNPATMTDPFGKATTFAFNATGDLLSRVDRNARRIDFEYDASHRVVKETWNMATPRVTAYSYDAAGALLSAQDPDSKLAMTYDTVGRLASVDNAGTPGAPRVVMSYGYDANGNVTQVADSLGGVTDYSYDGLDRLSRVTQSGTGVNQKRVDMTYTKASMLQQMKRFANLAGTLPVMNTSYEYECGGCSARLTAIRHRKASDNSVIHDLTYTRDALGNILSMIDKDGTHNYTYDKLRRLLSAGHSNTALQPNEFYTYDAVGNRLTSHLSAAYTYNKNRLTQDATYNYEYDNEGSQVKRTNRSTGAWTEYVYDPRNRMTAVVDKNAAGVEQSRSDYAYDALNRRIAAPGVKWAYDGLNPALKMQSSGTMISRRMYTRAIDGIVADEASSQTRWFTADQVGTARDLLANNASLVNHYTYDSFGQLKGQTGAGGGNDILFGGREFDSLAHLGYLRARYYWAYSGAFTQSDQFDPFGYDYANNNPLRFVDPTGTTLMDYTLKARFLYEKYSLQITILRRVGGTLWAFLAGTWCLANVPIDVNTGVDRVEVARCTAKVAAILGAAWVPSDWLAWVFRVFTFGL